MTLRAALAALLLTLLVVAPPVRAFRDAPDPLAGNALWIWHVRAAEGGDPMAIGEEAARLGVSTIIVKAAHGAVPWTQFSPLWVSAVKAQGLRVCAYQRLLGRHPGLEAAAAVRAVRAGADCLVIDAESELEGRYAQARRYMTALRAAVGAAYPLGLTSFPYNDYHPSFPYSVFLGPGGAQDNLPQVYWKLLGDPVGFSFARAYALNRIYDRPIRPIGQLAGRPRSGDVRRFVALAAGYGLTGTSWWNWDEAPPALLPSIAATAAPATPSAGWPVLGRGAHGDAVLWAKRHLRAAGYTVGSSTVFDARTQQAVAAFQASNGLAPTGTIGALTWPRLLDVELARRR